MLRETEIREQLFAITRTVQRAGLMYKLVEYGCPSYPSVRRGLLDLSMAGVGINRLSGLATLLMRSGGWETPPRFAGNSFDSYTDVAKAFCEKTLLACWDAFDPHINRNFLESISYDGRSPKNLYNRFLGEGDSETNAIDRALEEIPVMSADWITERIAHALRDLKLQVDAASLRTSVLREFEQAIALGIKESKITPMRSDSVAGSTVDAWAEGKSNTPGSDDQGNRRASVPKQNSDIEDGPLAPDKWVHGGKIYSRLTPKPWRFANALWKAGQRGIPVEELAKPVNRDHADVPSVSNAQNWKNSLNAFFSQHSLPFTARVANGFACLEKNTR